MEDVVKDIVRVAGTPVGSEIFSTLALFVISLAVILILRYYLPLRTTPAYLLVPIFFALALPTSIVFLVPIDLASNAGTDDGNRGIWLPGRVLLVSWRITYWLTFVLTWFILPILAEFSDAGYREMSARMWYSLRANAKYQAIVFGSGILGLIYVFVTAGASPMSLKGLLMALAYVWGLLLAIYLMGHGLVAIPRYLFRKANISGSLRAIQIQAPKVHERMEDAMEKLEALEAQVVILNKRKTGTAKVFQEWIEELADGSQLSESRPRGTRRMSTPNVSAPTVITENYLADLTRSLDRARHTRIRYIDEWYRLIQNAVATQAILDSAASQNLEIGKSSPRASVFERFTIFTPYTRYLYYYHIVPLLRYALGCFLALASFCIIWSEIIKSAFPSLSIISKTVVHHPGSSVGKIGFSGQAIAATWIFYMCTAALTSLTSVPTWRSRALVRRNTAYESAFWYAMQVARLSVPLSYNFMTFLDEEIYKKTVFFQFLGKLINLTPLGKWFDYLFPIFVLFPVCATLFNLYGRVKGWLGFGLLEDDEDENTSGYGTGSWREGRDLIERELGGDGSLNRGRSPLSRSPMPPPGGRVPYSSAGLGTRPAASRPSASTLQPEDVDEGFFGGLAHRMKNTVDTFETPEFISHIKKPKWMSGDNGAPGPARGSSFTRLFGGGRDDEGGGRVRL